MAIVANTFESGQANNTDLTTGNAAVGGDAPSSVTTTGGTVRFSTTGVAHGTLCMAVNNTSNNDLFVNWAVTGARTAAFRFYFWTDSVAMSAGTRIFSVFSATPTYYAGILIDTTGHLAIQNTAGTTLATTTAAFSANTLYRIEGSIDNSGGSAAGAMVVNAYAGESLTPVTNMQMSVTGANFGGGNITNVRLGRFTGTAAMNTTIRFDSFAYKDSTTTLLGPVKAPVLSGVSASSPSSTSGAVVGTGDAGTLVTTWNVQYGATASYGSTSTGGTLQPSAAAGSISETITGLTTGQVYHYRIAATNSIGTTYSADDTFAVMSSPAPVTYGHVVVIG